MDTWENRFPFTTEEVNLFARLHQKATKFPAPPGISVREELEIESITSTKVVAEEMDETKRYTYIVTE